MSSDDYRPSFSLNPPDSGHSTVSPSWEVSGRRPIDDEAVREQVALSFELQRWKKRYTKLEDRFKVLVCESGKNVEEELKSLSDEEHSFEIVDKCESLKDSQQPASSVNMPPDDYLLKQQSQERSVVTGGHSFTVVPKDGELSGCKRVFQGSVDKVQLHHLKTENEQLHEMINGLKTQLSLAEARVEESQSFSKSGVFTRSEEGTRGTGGNETSLRQVSTLQEDLDSIKKELTKAKEDADRALQERRDMKEALDHTLEEKLQLKEAHDRTLAEKLQLKEAHDRTLAEKLQLEEAHDRTLAEKLRLEGEVVGQKKIAKDWKMQLDETTCRLIQKQDEIEQLQRK